MRLPRRSRCKPLPARFMPLARFNSDRDKTKYTAEYRAEMAALQADFDKWARLK